jgi:uncharacterized protein
VLASFLGLPHAITVLAIPGVASNAWQVWSHRSSWRNASFLPPLIASAVVGLAAGTAFLKAAPPSGISLALGLALVVYVISRVARPTLRVPERVGHRVAPAIGMLAGAVQGATGISSPILASFLHAMQLDRRAYVFAISTVFLLFAALQLPALAVAGLVNWIWLFEGLLALLPVAAMMPVGSYLGQRLGQAVFDRLVLFFISAMAIRFVTDGLA